MGEGHVRERAGVVDEIAGREVVAAVDHEVVVGDKVLDVGRIDARLVLLDIDVRVHLLDELRRRIHLLATDVVVSMDDLSLEVGAFDDVVVHDTEGADASSREVLYDW